MPATAAMMIGCFAFQGEITGHLVRNELKVLKRVDCTGQIFLRLENSSMTDQLRRLKPWRAGHLDGRFMILLVFQRRYANEHGSGESLIGFHFDFPLLASEFAGRLIGGDPSALVSMSISRKEPHTASFEIVDAASDLDFARAFQIA